MIKIIDYIDEIIDKCFGDPELKELLEFSVHTTNVTIKDQFLHHYEKACYIGSKESLIRAILYRIHNNQDLILKLRDYKINLSKILNLGEYSKVRLSYKEELGTETSIGVSGSHTENKSNQADNYSGVDNNTNLSINDNKTGVSNTNKLEDLKDVIPQPTIEVSETPITLKTFRLEDDRLVETPNNYTRHKVNNPQYEETDEQIGYQNLTKDLTTNQSTDTNISSSSRGSSSSGDSTSKSANTTIKGNKSDAHDRTVEFITNDARVKLWTKELPRLKIKFWNTFFSLFVYEQSC